MPNGKRSLSEETKQSLKPESYANDVGIITEFNINITISNMCLMEKVDPCRTDG